MCSICRNPKCNYSFGKNKWKIGEELFLPVDWITHQITNEMLLEQMQSNEILIFQMEMALKLGIPYSIIMGRI